MIAADSAQQGRDSAQLYGDDSKRAFQRRIDTVSNSEAIANQTAATSRIAQEAIQANIAVRTPPA